MGESLIEQVFSQAAVWKTNRQLYPGWLIAPHETREHIWSFTERWIAPITRVLPESPFDKQLELLHEINWRLEISLIPLLSNIAPLVTASLESIDPTTDSSLLPNARLRLLDDRVDRNSPSWPEIQRYWTELAFALLRFHREERHRDEFMTWAGRLKKVARSAEESAHLSFERCLFSLGEMDDDSTRRELDDWIDIRGDHTWQLRKASIRAELGDLPGSEQLIRSTLHDLREGLRQSTDDIQNLSHEGWAMVLLNALENNHELLRGRTSDIRREFRGRWEQLSAYRCNPLPEIERLESRLDQPAPVPKPAVSQSASFQPGAYTLSYSLGSGDLDKLIPAYGYMRLTEEAPYPPRCGIVNLSEVKLGSAAKWFIRYDPVRTQTLVCRLAEREVIQTYFSRHRVAALPVQTATDFRLIALRAIGQAHQKMASADRVAIAGANERARRHFRAGIEILSRVTVRAECSELDEVWKLAIELYSSPVARRTQGVADALSELFRTLILSTPFDNAPERLIELLGLPIPGSSTFQVAVPDRWPEPSAEMGRRLAARSIRIDRKRGSRLIAGLLDAAKDENLEVRGRAIARLWVLYDYGCLSARDEKALAVAYWEKLNSETNLPDGMPSSAALMLPEPRPGMSVERFRQYALGSKLLPIQGGEVDPNRLLTDWLIATPPRVRNPRARRISRRRYVEWTSNDAKRMLAIILEWWQASGKSQSGQLRSPSAQHFFFVDRSYSERITLVLDVLRQILIPRIPPRSAAAKVILDFVSEMDQAGLAIASALPALLLLKPEEDEASRLRHALASPQADTYLSALRGLIYWLENQPFAHSGSGRRSQLPPPPVDLLHELGAIVEGRRQPGLLHALDAAIVVLRDFPETADRRFTQLLTIGLEYLQAETEYRSFEEANERIPYDEVPECRKMAAQIAVRLRAILPHEPSTVEKWIQSASSDPLPEVRQVVQSESCLAF